MPNEIYSQSDTGWELRYSYFISQCHSFQGPTIKSCHCVCLPFFISQCDISQNHHQKDKNVTDISHRVSRSHLVGVPAMALLGQRGTFGQTLQQLLRKVDFQLARLIWSGMGGGGGQRVMIQGDKWGVSGKSRDISHQPQRNCERREYKNVGSLRSS